MEFNAKLQELRKQKGWTQDELAKRLYVSRTAVSKWESGRGYPNIDSLKDIAKLFSVTVDELLSGEELLTLAETDGKQKTKRFRDWVFGLLDVSVLMFLFLPWFGQKVDGVLYEVSLLVLTGIKTYMRVLYFLAVIGLGVLGVVTLALQNYHGRFWERNKTTVSVLYNALGIVLFIISPQPYVALFLFIYFIIKIVLCIRV